LVITLLVFLVSYWLVITLLDFLLINYILRCRCKFKIYIMQAARWSSICVQDAVG
jgi:hypothetical protein